KLKAAHASAELIDFPDDVIAHCERRPAEHPRVQVAPDRHVGVLQTRGEHADAHLTPAGRRQGSFDHLEPVGTAEAPDLNNLVARLSHGQIPSTGGVRDLLDAPTPASMANHPMLPDRRL